LGPPWGPPAPTLSEEQGVVLTVLYDRARRGDEPCSVEEVAAGTAWPGERTYGVARTRRALGELRAAGLARRIASRADGVRWEARR
jgi:hypothetical protein